VAGHPQYGRAARAAAEILRIGYGVRVEKAENPLYDRGFVLLSNRLNRSLVRSVRQDEEIALRRVLEDLDVDWVDLSSDRRAQTIEKAKRHFLALPAAVVAGIVLTMSSQVNRIARETRQRSIQEFDLKIPSELGGDDVDSLSALLSSEGLHVIDEYARRAEVMSVMVAAAVAAGLATGAGSADIAGRVSELVRASQLARAAAYWDVAAMAAAGYARTATQLHAFSEAGIVTYKFVAVMDEKTTEICQYMNGRTLSVAKALDQLRRVESLETADAIRNARPWVWRGKDEDGSDILYFRKGERRVVVTHIDSKGVFTGGLSDEELEVAGLLVPPLHGRCRSGIIVF
jgi:hypothetical protein